MDENKEYVNIENMISDTDITDDENEVVDIADMGAYAPRQSQQSQQPQKSKPVIMKPILVAAGIVLVVALAVIVIRLFFNSSVEGTWHYVREVPMMAADATSDEAVESVKVDYYFTFEGNDKVTATIGTITSKGTYEITKNAEGKRDPEMHQTKKGNQWYFGAKLHAGVDAGTGYIHSLEVTAANVHDSAVATKLIREDDTVLYGDSAYCAVEKHADVQADPHLSAIEYRTNRQKPYRKNAWQEGEGTRWLKEMEYQKSRVRCKVEYVFHIIKNQFKFRKTRYRGTAKLKTKLSILCASANYYMLARSRRAEIEAKSLLAFLYEAAPQG